MRNYSFLKGKWFTFLSVCFNRERKTSCALNILEHSFFLPSLLFLKIILASMQLAWEHSDLGSVMHVSIKLCRPYNKLMKCSGVCLLQMMEVWFSEQRSGNGIKLSLHLPIASTIPSYFLWRKMHTIACIHYKNPNYSHTQFIPITSIVCIYYTNMKHLQVC